MKQSQWVIAVVALSILVFAATFAMQYLGGRRPADRTVIPASSERHLSFALKHPAANMADGGYLEQEARQEGHYDFWFLNDGTEDVKIGLSNLGCTCSSVSLGLLPEARRAQLLTAAPAARLLTGQGRVRGLTPGVALGPDGFGDVVSGVALETAARYFARQGVEERELLKQDNEGATVPAGAVGWVRLNWKGAKEGSQRLTAALWAGQRSSSALQGLQVSVVYHPPLRVQPTLHVGSVADDELKGSGREVGEIVCWSSTRFDVRLAARRLGGRLEANAQTFVVGKPRALDVAEREALWQRNNPKKKSDTDPGGNPALMGRVVCAYSVPIVLRQLAADGKTPIELGPFRRKVELSSPEDGIEPVVVDVTGRVLGPVEVGDSSDHGMLNLGEFPSRQGKTAALTLRSGVKGLTLALDEAATSKSAPFLTVEREQLARPADEGGARAWVLRVRVAPDQAHGRFPRPNDRRYEDGAVYLKAREPGKPERTIRVPVVGLAIAG